MVSYIRRFFDSRDFIEVETPMMNAIAYVHSLVEYCLMILTDL